MNKGMKPPVLEFWLTGQQWVQFTRVMDRCQRVAGGAVGPADCLEILCRSYLARRGEGAEREPREGIRRLRSFST